MFYSSIMKFPIFGFLREQNDINGVQSYWEITSDKYFDYIRKYVVGIGPWKDTVVPVKDNYLQTPTDLVARAHSHNLQVRFFCQKLLFLW